MTKRHRLDADEVVAALRPAAVLAHFQVEARRAGHELRTNACPSCGARSRDAVCIHAETGLWFDHAHGCQGNVLDLVAGFAGLDRRKDFPRVLAVAADIAGVSPTAVDDREVEARRAQRRREQEAEMQRQRSSAIAARELARDRAEDIWNRLFPLTRAGTLYLQTRGLEALAGRSQIVRFAPVPNTPETPWHRRTRKLMGCGACVPVHDLADGAITNVVTRRFEVHGDESKVVALPECPKVIGDRVIGTFGRWVDFRTAALDVVLVEGVADYLTATLLWPQRLVLGADGAGLLAKIVRFVGPPIAAAGRQLFLIPHADDAGERFNVAAGQAAVQAGLRAGNTLQFVDLGPHKDLNDAHCAGAVPDVG